MRSETPSSNNQAPSFGRSTSEGGPEKFQGPNTKHLTGRRLIKAKSRRYFRFPFFLADALFTFAAGFLAGFALRDFEAIFGLTRLAADFLAGFLGD
jgi:hypothetical protein